VGEALHSNWESALLDAIGIAVDNMVVFAKSAMAKSAHDQFSVAPLYPPAFRADKYRFEAPAAHPYWNFAGIVQQSIATVFIHALHKPP
jgi:hypothetical protein